MQLVDLLLVLSCVPVLACATYLFALTLLSRRRKPPPYPDPRLRFDVIVPAHNEELNIASTVESLLQTDYPASLRRVIVVADNSTDATAERARAAGAMAWVRDDPTKRGKGYALAFAFERSIREGKTDAVVVVDADTSVSPNLLRAFSARFEAGADAVQAEYGVRNRNASWRTRLMAIALAIFHDLRSLARERLRVSCGLRGNGMGFSTRILEEIPHDAFSVVEDVEYGIRLGKTGHRVFYVAEAAVLGDMVATEKESRSQRKRWEGGRMQLAVSHAPSLLGAAIRQRSWMLFDLTMDVLVPPLSYIVLAACVGSVAAVTAFVLGRATSVSLAVWGACVFMLAAYVSRGVILSGAGIRGFLDLAAAPVYVVWKVALALRGSGKGKGKGEWVRTARQGEKVP